MKRLMSIAALVLAASALSAQSEKGITVKAGAGVAHVVGPDADTRANFAAKAGISYDIRLFEGLYIVPEVDFALKGYHTNQQNSYSRAIHMTYMQFPVMAAYKIKVKEDEKVVIKVGPYFACGLFGSKADVSGGWGNSWRVDVFDSDYGFKRFDAGICTGIAYERGHLMMGFEYLRGLHRLYPDFRLYNQTFEVELGIRF